MTDGNLAGLLPPSAVRARVAVSSWQDAVGQAGHLLVTSGCSESRYTEAMRAAVTEFGPYIVIAPGVAMPHARPEHGVLRPGIALVTLATPVEFGNAANDPVDLVIAFAALDENAHVETLQCIAALLVDSARLTRIRAARNDAELCASLCLEDDVSGGTK